MDATAQHLMAQLRQNPLDPNLLEELRRHCERVRDPATWADALEHHARAASAADADPIELGRLHFELGNLYRDQLGRSDRAITHYRTAIDFDGAQRAAIAAARDIFSAAGKWDQVAKLLAREAETLPRGQKRAVLLREHAGLLAKQLGDPLGAIDALREAADILRDDLELSHELATLLLDQADHAPDNDEARQKREEAAEILCGMAGRVGDDYAFAYVEAALDAVPDHEPALRILQNVAPRMGRADSIPARWVASLQHAPEGPLSRELRMKLAIAYRTAGQVEDARVCLQPLLDRGDAEAQALSEELKPRSKAPSKRPSKQPRGSERPSKKSDRPKNKSERVRAKGESSRPLPASQPAPDKAKSAAPPPAKPKEAEDAPLFAPFGEVEDEPSQAAIELSSALSELRASEPETAAEASTPLDDLASLAAGDSARDEVSPARRPARLDDRTIVEASPHARFSEEGAAKEKEARTAFGARGADEPEREELTISGVEELRKLISEEEPKTQVDTSAGLAEAAARREEPDEPVTSPGVEAAPALAAAGFEPPTTPGGEHDGADEPPTRPGGDLPVSAEPLTNPGDEPLTVPAGQLLGAPLLETDSGTMNLDSGSFETGESVPDTQIEPATVDEAEEFDPSAARVQTGQERPAAESQAARAQPELPDETTQPRADAAVAARAIAAANLRDGQSSTRSDMRVAARVDSRASARPPAEDISEEPEDELTSLRRELRRRLRFRDRRGAAELAERMLAMGTLDADAITALEDQYRMTRDFRRMRDLAMRIAGELTIPVEQRLARLREAAMLSESKLGDVDGTAHAWREVLALVPTDEEANNKLRRLLTRLSRWDDLAQLLTQRAEADPQPHARADRYREIATLQRDRRKSVEEAIHALELARALDPEQPSDLATLCDLYVAAGKHQEAAQAFEQRIEQTAEPVERVPLLVVLADLYENDLQDLDAAYRSGEALLQIAPRHLASLDRLLRIDERLERWENVVRVLESKLPLGDAAVRAKLHARMGEIALHKLEDANRAADAYRQALDITPDERGLIGAATEAYDRAGRRDELTEHIGSAAQHARDAGKRFDLYQLVAERREADGDLSAAIAAREAQLAVRRDPHVLGLLVALLRRTDRANDLVRRLDELARSSEPRVARELRLERAAVLAEQLSNLEAAKSELVRVLDELSPDDVQILQMLVDLCRRTDDLGRRVEAQERLMRLAPSLEARIDLAQDLVDTFERVRDQEGQVRVLRVWIGFEPNNPQPYLRIVPLLEQSGLREELLATSDALARLAMGEEEVGEYLLRGARVAMELGDFDGAWQRLVPRVVEADDKEAEELLKQVAERGQRAEALAELYVGLAQREEGGPRGTRRWLDAAHTYEQMVGSPQRALEAVLRAFARNLDDAALWSEADRLAELAGAWPRLSQVYDTLVRRAETSLSRANILMRHAKLLEERAQDMGAALGRASLAFKIDPSYDPAFNEATRLARVAQAHEALIGLYEQRADAELPVDEQLDALLAAARCAFSALEDALRATSYLARGVLLADGDAALLDRIEQHAAELDKEDPPPTGQGLVHALSETYAREAQEGKHRQDLTILLWTRAAVLREDALNDLTGAYAAREQASLRKPTDEQLLDALIEVATRGKLLDTMAKHLAQRAERAIDSNTASAALIRLGALYEGPLASHDQAAETFAQLVKLNPRDPAAFSRLRSALKAGNKHKELLLAIERQLALASDNAARLALLKEAAQVWERDLKNRFEARDAWRKVSALAPDDTDATEAIARLHARPVLDDLSLLDGDLVVRPDDLVATIPPEPAPAPEPEAAPPAPEAELTESEATPATLETSAEPETERAESAQQAESAGETQADSAQEPATFSEQPGAEGDRLSELERAAYEASHVHSAQDEDGEAWDEARDDELAAVAGEPPREQGASAAFEAAAARIESQPADATLVEALEAQATSGAVEAEAEPGGAPEPGAREPDPFDTIDVPIEEAEAIEEASDEPASLDALDSMLQGPGRRGQSPSRAPQPPTRNGSTPGKSIRPPSPPRRD